MRTPEQIADRFWSKVRKSDGCWEWTDCFVGGGRRYGQFSVSPQRKSVRAHRYAWEMANGTIPPGMCVCHRCDNPACVRLSHLFLGTQQDNQADKVAKGRVHRTRSEDAPLAKLTEVEVREIRALLRDGLLQADVGARFGVTQSNVSCIGRGKTWKGVA